MRYEAAAVSPLRVGYPPVALAWVAMAVLMVTYLFSWLDRSVLLLLIDPVRRDFFLTDSQIGILTGPALAIVYACAAIPLTRLGDLWSRKWVIIIGIIIWSTMTIASGLTHSFARLMIARTGVGLGEAALTANAYTLTAELFAPGQRGRAMSLFVLGQSLGAGVALVAGGALLGLVTASDRGPLAVLGVLAPWRQVLVVVGAMTLVWSVVVAFTPEPPRTVSSSGTRLADCLRRLVQKRAAYCIHFVALPIWNLSAYAFATWAPTFFIREHGWVAPMTGARLGWTSLVAAILATLVDGWLADRLYASPVLVAKLIAYSTLASVPFLIWGAFTSGPYLALTALTIATFLSGSVAVLGPLSLHMITPPGLRGGMTALFLLVANLIGIGVGPPLVALASAHFTGPHRLGAAIALVCSVTTLGPGIITWVAAGAFAREARDMASE